MNPLGQFLLAGVGTYLIRLSAIVLVSHTRPPSDRSLETLRLIAPAVLAAIVADQLFIVDGALAIRCDWWIAGVASAAVAARWKSAGITMATGIIVALAISSVV